jgi:hypothetical protein
MITVRNILRLQIREQATVQLNFLEHSVFDEWQPELGLRIPRAVLAVQSIFINEYWFRERLELCRDRSRVDLVCRPTDFPFTAE